MPRFWDDLKRKAKRVLLDKELSGLKRDYELEVIRSLPDVEFDAYRPTGVLLSDEIERYTTDYRLISPFNPSKLKPAAYELSVGGLYSIVRQNARAFRYQFPERDNYSSV
jgi:hypothetical protein